MVDSIGVKPSIATDRRIAPVTTTTAPKAVVATARDGGGDTANVSLTGLSSDLAQSAPIDSERVALIRRAVAAGTFPINPARIADQMIAMKYEWTKNDAA
jgi:negative regulator of flagellin synthesis FlgM